MKLKKFSKLIAILLLSINLSQASVLTELHGTKGQADKELKSMVEKLENIGFTATSKNEHIENHYFNKFKEKNLDLLNFYTILDKESLRELLLKNPNFGAYAPFNLLAFKEFAKEEGGDSTWYGHLNSETMLNIIGEKDKDARDKFTKMLDKLDNFIQDEMKPTSSKKLTFEKELPAQPLLKMVKKFEDVDDIEEYVEEFIMKHDSLFGKNEFIIAGFIDLKFEYDDMELDFDKYDAYWVSSLCHFEFSNSVFNHGSPQAAIFAPCSVYFYIPKGSNELHVGYASVENWIQTTGITDKAQIKYMKKIASDVIKTFKQLGFEMEGGSTNKVTTPKAETPKVVTKKVETPKVETKKVITPTVVTTVSNTLSTKKISSEISELKTIILKMAKDIEEIKKKDSIENKSEENLSKLQANKRGVVSIHIPKPPKVKKAITLVVDDDSDNNINRAIKFSKRVPANYITSAQRYGEGGKGSSLSSSKEMIGEVDKGRISAYLRGELLDVKTASDKLKNAGFEVITATPLDKKKTLISIVFTSDELKKMASKTNRGYMGTLRLLIDPKNNQISITNPLYLAKAFMQDEFNDEIPKKILTALNSEFKGLRNSMDKLKFQLLPKYQFMKGMPYFEDMDVVARGNDLLEKIQTKKNKKKVAFQIKLDNGSVLIGIKLSKHTAKFPKKIGTNNAGMLPYPVLIENNEAKILEPKYYLSLMYPQLSMEQFMTIATIPDAIVRDCGKVFR